MKSFWNKEIFYSGSQWNESKVLSTRDDKQPPYLQNICTAISGRNKQNKSYKHCGCSMFIILSETEIPFLCKQSYWCSCCQRKTSFKWIIFTCPWGGVRPASMQSRVKIVLSLAVSASTSGSVSPGVDPYSLMYLYKYTGKG